MTCKVFIPAVLLLALFGCETSAPQWHANYHRLRPNMTQVEVTHLLGQPANVNVSKRTSSKRPGQMITWGYTDYTEPISNLSLYFQGDKLWRADYNEFDTQNKIISQSKSLFDLYLQGPR